MIKWEEVAKNFLELEKANSKYAQGQVGIILSWQESQYIGSLQEILPIYSKEIVLLSKSSKSVVPQFTKAIRQLDKNRLEVIADNNLDLSGRQHVLRRVENLLSAMTLDQTMYISKNLPTIYEL